MNESSSTVSELEVAAEAELELGLSLGGGGGRGGVKSKPSPWGECGRILTAKDFPSVLSHGSSSKTHSKVSERPNTASVSGTKRTADTAADQESGTPNGASQVVGWPPIRAYRMNSLASQAKSLINEEDRDIAEHDKVKDSLKKKCYDGSSKNNTKAKVKGHLRFIKVNMDGLPIGRKVDLSAHSCYETLAQILEDMFFTSTPTINFIRSCKEKDQATNCKLLDGSSEFVLTYEDKEGDWMLVGDVPWGMFLSTVKRLRIMRTSEANGLAPRFQERNERPRNKPI